MGSEYILWPGDSLSVGTNRWVITWIYGPIYLGVDTYLCEDEDTGTAMPVPIEIIHMMVNSGCAVHRNSHPDERAQYEAIDGPRDATLPKTV